MDRDSILKYSKVDFFDVKGSENERLFEKMLKDANTNEYKMDIILFCYLDICDRNLSYLDDKDAFEKVNFHEKLVTEKKFKCGSEEWKGQRIISKIMNKDGNMKTWYLHHLMLEGPWQEDVDFQYENCVLGRTIFNYFGKKPTSIKMKSFDKGKGFTIKIKNDALSTIFIIEFKSTMITSAFSFYLDKGTKLTKYYANSLWETINSKFIDK